MPANDTRSDDAPGEREIRRIRRRLLAWGRAHFRDYPWRSETSPWLSLVAEVLLQRTRASQVQQNYAWLKREFPTPEALIRAGDEAGITARLGLHFRGTHLLALARLVGETGGEPPDSIEWLRAVRGIGPYTLAAWLSLHRGKRAVIVDSNVARWLARLTGREYQRDPRGVRWVNELADRLTPRRAFRTYNYAVLDFTMEVCGRGTPRCDICPLRRHCAYGGRHSNRGNYRSAGRTRVPRLAHGTARTAE